MTRARVLGLLLACAMGLPAHAGHGLLNAFADIEWLPDPGRTPDDVDYVLDGLAERIRLAAAGEDARFDLCLVFAREKLAEVDAMVRADKRGPAETAVAAYRAYLDRAAELVAASPAAREPRARALAGALLEHQYIMSVDYLDLPRGARRAIHGIREAASARYEALTTILPPAFKQAQFFKEEEVRWSWEMARRADEQGL